MDGSMTVLNAFARIFENLGYPCDCFSDEKSCLESMAAGVVYHAALVDHYLPGTHGPDFVAKLKARSPELKIIIASSSLGNPTADELKAAGADAVFMKPVSVRKLMDQMS